MEQLLDDCIINDLLDPGPHIIINELRISLVWMDAVGEKNIDQVVIQDRPRPGYL